MNEGNVSLRRRATFPFNGMPDFIFSRLYPNQGGTGEWEGKGRGNLFFSLCTFVLFAAVPLDPCFEVAFGPLGEDADGWE